MPLAKEQIKKLQDWMVAKGVSDTCPSCGKNVWETGDIIGQIPYAKGALTIGVSSPMVQMGCKNCGFVRLYSATLIGLA